MGPSEAFVIIPFFLVFAVIGILGFVLWIWAVIDCATNDYLPGNDKIVWILVVVLAGVVGAIIYYFIARKAIAQEKYRPPDRDNW